MSTISNGVKTVSTPDVKDRPDRFGRRQLPVAPKVNITFNQQTLEDVNQ